MQKQVKLILILLVIMVTISLALMTITHTLSEESDYESGEKTLTNYVGKAIGQFSMAPQRYKLTKFGINKLAQRRARDIVKVKYWQYIKEESEYIISAQRDTGVIKVTPSSNWIVPPHSTQATEALLESGTIYQENVKNYMDWHFAHINQEPDILGVAGTIYDYKVQDDGTESPDLVKVYDASDSYGALFLSLVKRYYDITGDTTYITNYLDDLKLIASSVDATFNENGPKAGLCDTKPDYAIAYTMDNIVVWKGYKDFGELLTALNDPLAGFYTTRANTVRQTIEEKLWDEENYYYKWHAGAGGVTNWNKWYGDTTANMWPLVIGLPEAVNNQERKTMLFNQFKEHFPDWVNLYIYDSVKDQVIFFPWASIGVAAVESGDLNLVKKYDINLQKSMNTKGSKYYNKKWPWHISESAWRIKYLKRIINSI